MDKSHKRPLMRQNLDLFKCYLRDMPRSNAAVSVILITVAAAHVIYSVARVMANEQRRHSTVGLTRI